MKLRDSCRYKMLRKFWEAEEKESTNESSLLPRGKPQAISSPFEFHSLYGAIWPSVMCSCHCDFTFLPGDPQSAPSASSILQPLTFFRSLFRNFARAVYVKQKNQLCLSGYFSWERCCGAICSLFAVLIEIPELRKHLLLVIDDRMRGTCNPSTTRRPGVPYGGLVRLPNLKHRKYSASFTWLNFSSQLPELCKGRKLFSSYNILHWLLHRFVFLSVSLPCLSVSSWLEFR